MSNTEGGLSSIDTGLVVTLKEKESLMLCIDDIPKQASKYAEYMSNIKTSIDTNVWTGADGTALKEKFDGYLDQLILRQKELDKLSELALNLKKALENAENKLETNIRSINNE